MEEFLTKDRANYYSGIISITVNGKAAYELKGKFLEDLRENAFNGTNGEDAVKHIEYFLKFFDPIDYVNYERVDLTEKFFGKYYPPSRTCNVVGTEAKNDPTNTMFEKWLASKFANHMMMDPFTRKVLWDFWKKVDNQEGVTNEGFSDLEEVNNEDEHKIAKIFRIETNLFDYETPLCIKFNEFNYLLKVDTELFTHDIERTKTYEDYRNELNNEVDEPCLKNVGGNKQILDALHYNMRVRILDHTEMSILPMIVILRVGMVEHATTVIFRKRRNSIKMDDEEKYVAIKEYEYDDLTRTSEDACHTYQEIFHNMDEGWLVTRAE
ncbi:hypothetical protein Tco_0461002 [Tanacetum coccineum]